MLFGIPIPIESSYDQKEMENVTSLALKEAK